MIQCWKLQTKAQFPASTPGASQTPKVATDIDISDAREPFRADLGYNKKPAAHSENIYGPRDQEISRITVIEIPFVDCFLFVLV